MSGPRSKSAAVQSLPWPRAGLPFAVCAAALIAILIEWRLLSTVAQPSQFEEIPTATCDASDLGYRCMYGVPDSGYYVHWNAPVNNTVNMAVRANANSWIGIGWNSQNEMKGAVAAVGINFQVLQRYLYDYKAELIRPYSGLFAPESPTSIERQGANLTMRWFRTGQPTVSFMGAVRKMYEVFGQPVAVKSPGDDVADLLKPSMEGGSCDRRPGKSSCSAGV
ncbi:hypothetical protein CBR_g27873 [Chara braunii]|uniref:DOMON domain-containing protein n=1 Tax=Chara braunii TaxID=69332 RepID=A0A388L8M1_CHABU|nr:hypothetical protein CBR_g27873 [Chara braunii]|eukprot:GBG78647.1 hypothetical protein CBR_g27873 [Chara braunii]